MQEQKVAIRGRGGENLGSLSAPELIERLSTEVKDRKDLPLPAIVKA
jgi:threonyl-tRNA synthetase